MRVQQRRAEPLACNGHSAAQAHRLQHHAIDRVQGPIMPADVTAAVKKRRAELKQELAAAELARRGSEQADDGKQGAE